MDRWASVFHLRWYAWALVDLYEAAIGVAVSIFAIGALGVAAGSRLGWISEDATWRQPWYVVWPSVAFGLFLAWVALKAVGTSIVDVFCPAAEYEGPLDSIERRHVSGKLGGFDVWELTSNGRTWQVPFADSPSLPTTVAIGGTVRLRYRRGTQTVTHVWIAA